MSRQFWKETLAWLTADGTAVHTTATETIIVPNYPVPANFMQDGRVLRGRVFGKLSTAGTPTITFAIRWGGVAGTILAISEAITNGSGVANVNWDLEFYIQTRANGAFATGKLLCWGVLRVHTAAGTVVTNVFGVSGHDAPAEVAVDLSVAADLAVTVDWSASSASNTATAMGYVLDSEN